MPTMGADATARRARVAAMTTHGFVDEAQVSVTSGNGGDGMVSFRREKFVPFGGPDGGDGGRGGDVVFVADRNLNTLSEFHQRQQIKAKRGGNGGTSGKTGAGGPVVEVRLPLGTVVYDANEPEDGEPLIDLAEDGACFVVARGGKGGLGNRRFKSSRRQAPDFALPGLPGETRNLRLSLKLLADVGLVGFPNAGKSTLLRRISSAKPRVAAYPFTTLTPSLGVVAVDDQRFVVADIPGLIEGASDGAGLGHQFLRHVERTRVLVHLLDVGAMLMEDRDLLADYDAIRRELERYQPALLERREIVLLNKIDLVGEPEQIADVENKLRDRGLEVHRLSGITGDGTKTLIIEMLRAVQQTIAEERAAEEVGVERERADGVGERADEVPERTHGERT
jgi:GTP-binding protein